MRHLECMNTAATTSFDQLRLNHKCTVIGETNGSPTVYNMVWVHGKQAVQKHIFFKHPFAYKTKTNRFGCFMTKSARKTILEDNSGFLLVLGSDSSSKIRFCTYIKWFFFKTLILKRFAVKNHLLKQEEGIFL